MPSGQFWPPENIEAMRQDAANGLSMHQCCDTRGFRRDTVRKHARIHGITFEPDGQVVRLSTTDQQDARHLSASIQLTREIEAAKREARTAPIYRGRPDDF